MTPANPAHDGGRNHAGQAADHTVPPEPPAADDGQRPRGRVAPAASPDPGAAADAHHAAEVGAGHRVAGTASSAEPDRLDEAIDAAEQAPSVAVLEGDAVIAAAELIAARAELAERTEDLQRAQADYANYRKRVDRDRAVAGDLGRGEVLAALISTLDDIDAARTAGDLAGPFAAVAEKLEATVGRFGMERYGQVGDPFDPAIHEALMHEVSSDAVGGPTVSLVIQPGYRMGERVIRAARVGVVEAG